MTDETAGRKSRRRRRRRRRLLFLLLIILLGGWLSRSWVRAPEVPDGSYVLVDLQGGYAEQAPDDLLGFLFGRRALSFLDVLMLLRDAREDSRVAGVVVRFRPLAIGWAKAQDIREELLAYREAGKPLVAYLEHEFAPSTLELYVASAAQTIYLPRGATAPLNGLQAQFLFLGGVWEKLDIDMQVEKIREYKTAGDMIANKKMSPYHREMANSLLDSIFEQVVTGIASARDLDQATVRAAIDASPATADELLENGLADGAKFLDEVRVEMLGPDQRFLSAEDFRQGRRPSESVSDDRIAVVYGVGPVMTGESQRGALHGDVNMAADTLSEAFRQATDNTEVRAIVFRVDSPGGSALASDLIWRATRKARDAKPVIVSMSDVAGSGGYYVAAGASRIIARPGTLTGSIGVVMSKPNLRGFLAKLGVNTESLARGELAEMTSLTKSLSTAERARLLAAMDHVYDLFIERVATGRNLTPEQVHGLGRGRVWTGAQARANGLVDELGGFFAAINAAKSAAGIPVSERLQLVFYPKHKGFIERLTSQLGTRVFGPPPVWWQRARTSFIPYQFPPGSVLTLMPQAIRIR